MNQLNQILNCCGCTACATICPKSAITMEPDEKGFLYPQIDEKKCINCGLCKQVCAFNSEYDKSHLLNHTEIFAVHHIDLEERKTSRSGAMFTALSEYFIQQGGVVYGAVFDKELTVCHKRVETKDDLFHFKGSKYVQSDMKDSFLQVQQDLEAGKLVLFSGTPCQTAGLYSFADMRCKKYLDHLYICDIVCHGVPSPFIYRDYLSWQEKKNNQKIMAFNFRDKAIIGWDSHEESMILKSGKKVYSRIYTDLFRKCIMFRSSCYQCPFTNFQRPSDITLGDFWGIDKCMPDFADNIGNSLILINSSKGKEVFELVKNQLDYRMSNQVDCMQPSLKAPSTLSLKTMAFWQNYQKCGFRWVLFKYGQYSPQSLIKRAIRKFSRFIAYIMRKILIVFGTRGHL